MKCKIKMGGAMQVVDFISLIDQYLKSVHLHSFPNMNPKIWLLSYG